MTLATNPKEWMWEQKFRPQTLSECILPEKDIARFAGIIKEGRIPNILLSSKSPGTGKTTMAHALCNEVDANVMFISGGELRINDLRTTLTQFASGMTMKPGGNVIIIDEGDNKGMREVHAELRSWMEAYSHNCSVIMTCNNLEAIPDPLQSRFRTIEFGNPTETDKLRMMKEMIVRCIKICEQEGVKVESRKAIAALVKKNFPDLRGTVTELDAYGKCGRIDEGVLSQALRATEDMDDLINYIKKGQLGEVRKLLPKFTADYGNFITSMYNRLFLEVKPTSIRMLVGLISENQKTVRDIPNLEIHIFDLVMNLAGELEFKK